MFGIDLPKGPKSSAAFEVWDENWDIVMMFLRMQTQWNTTMSGYLGLKYDVLLMAGGLFDLYCVEDRLATLEGLRIMEMAVLNKLSTKGDK